MCLLTSRRAERIRAINGASFNYRVGRLVRRVTQAYRTRARITNAVRCRIDYLCRVLEALLRNGAARRNCRLLLTLVI